MPFHIRKAINFKQIKEASDCYLIRLRLAVRSEGSESFNLQKRAVEASKMLHLTMSSTPVLSVRSVFFCCLDEEEEVFELLHAV